MRREKEDGSICCLFGEEGRGGALTVVVVVVGKEIVRFEKGW